MDIVPHIIQYIQAGRAAAEVQLRVDVGVQSGKMPHRHDYWEVKGTALDGGSDMLPQIVVSPPGVVHDTFINGRRHELTFIFEQTRFVCCFRHHGVGGSFAPPRVGGLPAIYSLLVAIQRYADDSGALPPSMADDFRRLLLFAFVNILEGAGRHLQNATDPVYTARWFMESNFADMSLDVKQIGEVAGQSPQNLNRIFRLHMGCSLWQYLMKLRLRHARELLETASVTVMEAAHLSGFADRSNFSKYFARAFGISPAVYRNVHSRGLCTQDGESGRSF